MKKKRVRYQRCLVCHLDLLGFRQLVQQRRPGEISRLLRLFSDEVSPKTGAYVRKLNRKQFVSFSDLHITVIPVDTEDESSRGLVFLQLLRLVHAQTILFFDHGIVVRGAVVIGNAVRSHGRFFGQGLIDAYEIESSEAIYPRIIVSESVLEELEHNSTLWTHDREGEIKVVKGLLHFDQESGRYYIDYLRVMREELDDPGNFGEHLEQFKSKINAALADLKDPRARSKLEWMLRYCTRVRRQAKL